MKTKWYSTTKYSNLLYCTSMALLVQSKDSDYYYMVIGEHNGQAWASKDDDYHLEDGKFYVSYFMYIPPIKKED